MVLIIQILDSAKTGCKNQIIMILTALLFYSIMTNPEGESYTALYKPKFLCLKNIIERKSRYDKIELTSDQLAAADVNNDGVVDTIDASMHL